MCLLDYESIILMLLGYGFVFSWAFFNLFSLDFRDRAWPFGFVTFLR